MDSENTFPDLPYNGVYHRAEKKISVATVIFLHHFGGSQENMERHVELVNKCGYDAVVFDLKIYQNLFLAVFPFTKKWGWGLRSLWLKRMDDIISLVPGDKIIYAFSISCALSLSVLGKRGYDDIKGIVFDGGPFDWLRENMDRLLKYYYRIPFAFIRKCIIQVLYFFWGSSHSPELIKNLTEFPADVPVFSIKGKRDKIIPPKVIENLLSLNPRMKVDELSFPMGGHIDGLKKYPDKYGEAVSVFLKSCSL
jgi:pimeloyl-ACP methyl ester carboxylesterase